MNKNEIIGAFVSGATKGKGSNLEIIGDRLYNYRTIIAVRTERGNIILNTRKYSQTTSRNQNLLKKEATVIKEVDGDYELQIKW